MRLSEVKKQHRDGRITKQSYIEQMHEKHLILYQYADFIYESDIHSIEISEGDVIVTSKSRKIRLYASRNDMRIAPMEMLNFGSYEERELSIIGKIVPDDVSFFDIGANIGWYTLNIAKMKLNARVYAFEPIPKTFCCLQRNISLNGAQNVTVHPHGFSDTNDILTFYYYPEVSGNASLANLSNREDAEHIDCQVVRLDDFMKTYSGRIDFIKCDVEGAELFVFKGGMETIRGFKPIIFTEMLRKWSARHNYHPNEIIDLLGAEGYSCFVLSDDKLKGFFRVDDRTEETNFFFLHRKKHSEIIKTMVA